MATVRPRIGLTASVMPTRLGTRRTFLNEPYIVAIQESGGIPLVVTPAHGGPPLRALFELLDGLVLTGGEDVAPERYGEEVLHPSVEWCPSGTRSSSRCSNGPWRRTSRCSRSAGASRC